MYPEPLFCDQPYRGRCLQSCHYQSFGQFCICCPLEDPGEMVCQLFRVAFEACDERGERTIVDMMTIDQTTMAL